MSVTMEKASAVLNDTLMVRFAIVIDHTTKEIKTKSIAVITVTIDGLTPEDILHGIVTQTILDAAGIMMTENVVEYDHLLRILDCRGQDRSHGRVRGRDLVPGLDNAFIASLLIYTVEDFMKAQFEFQLFSFDQ